MDHKFTRRLKSLSIRENAFSYERMVDLISKMKVDFLDIRESVVNDGQTERDLTGLRKKLAKYTVA